MSALEHLSRRSRAVAATRDRRMLIVLLDKVHPPHHSFVDGMLARVMPMATDTRVWLLVSSPPDGSTSPSRHYRAGCWPYLAARRGVGRLRNLWRGVVACRALCRKAARRGVPVVIMVRNDPVLLVAGALSRRRAGRVVFQSSFPHERHGRFDPKAAVARLLFRLCRKHVDAITAVSVLGMERVHSHFPQAQTRSVIPLLAGLPLHTAGVAVRPGGCTPPIRFVYAGSHAAARELEVVLQAISEAVKRGAHGRFTFIGGEAAEIGGLMASGDVQHLVDRGCLQFIRRVERPAVVSMLASGDVGISAIPPTATYEEASPTKVAEYMHIGLAVLATKGIPAQEAVVNASQAGVLVEWGVSDIAEAIVDLAARPDHVSSLKQAAAMYAIEHLQYSSYVESMHTLMGPARERSEVSHRTHTDKRHSPAVKRQTLHQDRP